jgi:hypothetical protein
MSISYQNHSWKWELDSFAHSQSSTLISQHLIVPLIITSGLAFNSATSTPIPDQSATNLQKELDKAAKFARRSPLLNIIQALKRPRLATSLQRVSAVVHSVEEERLRKSTPADENMWRTYYLLAPVLLEFDEMTELLEETPVAESLLKSTNRGRSYSPKTVRRLIRPISFMPGFLLTRVTKQSSKPTHTEATITHKRASPPLSKTYQRGRDHEKDQDQTFSSQDFPPHASSQNIEEPDTLYTGPPHAAKASIQAAHGSDESQHADADKNEGEDDSVTESGSDSESASLPPPKKRRVLVDETPETPSGTSISRRAPSVTKDSARKSTSDSDSEEGPTKQVSPSRGGVGGGKMRVKQPIKRGGRRI